MRKKRLTDGWFERAVVMGTKIYDRGARDEGQFDAEFDKLWDEEIEPFVNRQIEAFLAACAPAERADREEAIGEQHYSSWKEARAAWRCLCAGVEPNFGNLSTASMSLISGPNGAMQSSDPAYLEVIRQKAKKRALTPVPPKLSVKISVLVILPPTEAPDTAINDALEEFRDESDEYCALYGPRATWVVDEIRNYEQPFVVESLPEVIVTDEMGWMPCGYFRGSDDMAERVNEMIAAFGRGTAAWVTVTT